MFEYVPKSNPLIKEERCARYDTNFVRAQCNFNAISLKYPTEEHLISGVEEMSNLTYHNGSR